MKSPTGKMVYLSAILLVIGSIVFMAFRGHKNNPRKNIRKIIPSDQEMILVPAGWFWMGSDSGETDEKPVHKVWIDSFYIDMFPVTNAQYAAFIAATGHEKPRYWNKPECNDLKQPVVGVDFNDVSAYCHWRSQTEGGRFRLPTEAEWEKAARGEDRRTFPWGKNSPSQRHANTKLQKKMPKIGMCDLGASPYGVKDMVGNVWNWCQDWYARDTYGQSTAKNPQGPKQRGRLGKVVRGGNWVFLGCCSGSPDYALRVTRRKAFHENIRKKSIGFRCVREVTKRHDTN